MKTAKEIITEHGGSFERLPFKGAFWLPMEVSDGALSDALRPLGREIRLSRPAGNDGWRLFRFVGERKPYKQIKVRDHTATNNISEELTLRVYPNGIIEIREKGRKVGFETTVAQVYIRCMLSAAMKRMNEKRRGKKRKGRK